MSKILVAYFSRADENYNVGNITVGNTKKIAKILIDELKADEFEIKTVNAYPKNYRECIALAKKELKEQQRPEIKGDISLNDYSTIFLGYPNWWAEPPMAIYSFIEKHSFEGKKVIPFVTHEGSGIGTTQKALEKKLVGATVIDGFAVEGSIAQNDAIESQHQVKNFLQRLKL